MYALVLLLAAASLGSTKGLEWVNGTCPDWRNLPRYIPEGGLFDRYLYQQRSLNNYLFKEEGKCGKLYNSAEHGILLSTYQQKRIDNTPESGIVYAEIEGDKDFPTTHIFNMKFLRNDDPTPINFSTMLVATDQHSYAVLYSCRSMLDRSLDLNTNPRKMETVLVFTVHQGDSSFDDQIKEELADIGLDYDSFKTTDQTNC